MRDSLLQRLAQAGQQHLARHCEQLNGAARTAFEAQLEAVDWHEISQPGKHIDRGVLRPPKVVSLLERPSLRPQYEPRGEQLYRQGKVAVLIVAGGQGTRLGFDGPKGCYPLLPATVRRAPTSIYELLAGKVARASRLSGHKLPLLLMTSPYTDEQTRAFFAAQENFGLADDQVRFFSQGTVPSVDGKGRALLADEGQLLLNPDGHGGCFEALVNSGQLARLQAQGIEWLLYLQVDNVLAKVWDPFAVGLASAMSADALTKVLQKRDPDERVGHLVRANEHDAIVEYTELTQAQVRELADDGAPLFRWGNTAMHCWRLNFLANLAARDVHLPLHRSRKPLRSWRAGAHREVQGIKCERFIFDLLHHAKVSVGLEVARHDEFAPVKNATGDDSPATARAALAN